MRRDHRHGNAPRQHPRRYRRRRTAVPFHEQTLPPMVLPMRYPGRPPPPPPPGAGSKVRAAAPRRRGGVGARITAIVSPPRRPRSRGSSSHQNSAPRHEPVDPPERRVVCDRPGRPHGGGGLIAASVCLLLLSIRGARSPRRRRCAPSESVSVRGGDGRAGPSPRNPAEKRAGRGDGRTGKRIPPPPSESAVVAAAAAAARRRRCDNGSLGCSSPRNRAP